MHWYMDPWVPPAFLADTHSKFPDVFILSTEACAGYGYDGHGVSLGNWERGEEYGHYIMQVNLPSLPDGSFSCKRERIVALIE